MGKAYWRCMTYSRKDNWEAMCSLLYTNTCAINKKFSLFMLPGTVPYKPLILNNTGVHLIKISLHAVDIICIMDNGRDRPFSRLHRFFDINIVSNHRCIPIG